MTTARGKRSIHFMLSDFVYLNIGFKSNKSDKLASKRFLTPRMEFWVESSHAGTYNLK